MQKGKKERQDNEMQKEFPYYDRCKDIFLPNRTTTPTILPPPAPRLFGNTETAVSGPESSTPHPSTSYETDIPTMDHRDTVSPEPSSSSLLPSLPNPSTTTVNTFKKRRISQGNGNSSMPVEETKLRVLEMELEVKKMEHEERMQEMKLEQLRLEIEMQKLKQARQTTTDFNVTKPHT
ncbi:uncharacterized protein BYT42DRAFT_406606 [Radiomyces spectabilis]|uniref:uncharacterized protein n=1 Tax=Radiomyces spectabilis TaxID=64574 RepID=UPI002220BB1B|nr:uncharacterized protein BYT42DRAFT_406606 [Radiomyces spectabilis]KAI8374488.1 hypothetical protein BYT42DRAFT_406606 [Radiomyces spectabilis]